MRQYLAPLAAAALAAPGLALAQETAAQPERLGMAGAIEAAQAQVEGGVLEADLGSVGGVLAYEIELVRGQDIFELHVEAQTGEIISQSEEEITGFLSGIFQEDQLVAAEAARGTLVQALSDLEAQDGVQIDEIELEDEDGRWVYQVELRDAAGEREVWIDAASGELWNRD